MAGQLVNRNRFVDRVAGHFYFFHCEAIGKSCVPFTASVLVALI
jgi:hypothetical protein